MFTATSTPQSKCCVAQRRSHLPPGSSTITPDAHCAHHRMRLVVCLRRWMHEERPCRMLTLRDREGCAWMMQRVKDHTAAVSQAGIIMRIHTVHYEPALDLFLRGYQPGRSA